MTMFTAQEREDLEQLFASTVNKEDVLSLDGLHGFLFGLAIIPEPIMPSEWIPELLGKGMIEVPGQKEASRLVGSVLSVYNRIIHQSRDGELEYPFDYDTIEQKDFQRMSDWAKWFFVATKLRPEIWGMDGDVDYDDLDPGFDELEEIEEIEEIDGDYEEEFEGNCDKEAEISWAVAVITGVAYPERIPELFDDIKFYFGFLDRDDPELEAKVFAMLQGAVETLRDYAELYAEDFKDDLESRNADNYKEPQMPIHVEKIGRNSPCPCGSGAKYKKCCGK